MVRGMRTVHPPLLFGEGVSVEPEGILQASTRVTNFDRPEHVYKLFCISLDDLYFFVTHRVGGHHEHESHKFGQGD
jgi:hypothetical protein